jgi:type IV secretory pathway TrbL component
VATSVAETASDTKAIAEAAAATAATTVSDMVGDTGTYLQEKGLEGLMGDAAGWVRRYPIPSLWSGWVSAFYWAAASRRPPRLRARSPQWMGCGGSS